VLPWDQALAAMPDPAVDAAFGEGSKG